jgi:hypothetical protein
MNVAQMLMVTVAKIRSLAVTFTKLINVIKQHFRGLGQSKSLKRTSQIETNLNFSF